MAALRKLGSKLFLSSSYSHLEPSREPSIDPGYTSVAKDKAISPSVSPSPPKLTRARSMILMGLFGSVSNITHRPNSYIDPDEPTSPGPDTPGFETPKKQKVLWGRVSSTRSWSNRKTAWNLKRHRATISDCERDLSYCPVPEKRDSSPDKLHPALNIDIPSPGFDQTVSEAMLESGGIEDLSCRPNQFVGPKVLWPGPPTLSKDTADPYVEQTAPGSISSSFKKISVSLEGTPSYGHVTHCKSNFTPQSLQNLVSAKDCVIRDFEVVADKVDLSGILYQNPDHTWVDPLGKMAANDLPTTKRSYCGSETTENGKAAQEPSTSHHHLQIKESSCQDGTERVVDAPDDRRTLPSYTTSARSEMDSSQESELVTTEVNRPEPLNSSIRRISGQSSGLTQVCSSILDGTPTVVEDVGPPIGSRTATKCAESPTYDGASYSRSEYSPKIEPQMETLSLRYADEAIRRKSSMELEDQLSGSLPYGIDGIDKDLGNQLLEKAKIQAMRSKLVILREKFVEAKPELLQANLQTPQMNSTVISAGKPSVNDNDHSERLRLPLGDRFESPTQPCSPEVKSKTSLRLLRSSDDGPYEAGLYAAGLSPRCIQSVELLGEKFILPSPLPPGKQEAIGPIELPDLAYDDLYEVARHADTNPRVFSQRLPFPPDSSSQSSEHDDSLVDSCSRVCDQQAHPCNSSKNALTEIYSKSPNDEVDETTLEHSALEDVANLKVWEFLEGLVCHSSEPLAGSDAGLTHVVKQQSRKSANKSGNVLANVSENDGFARSKPFGIDDNALECCTTTQLVGFHNCGCYPSDPTNPDTIVHRGDLSSDCFQCCLKTRRFGQHTCGCHPAHVYQSKEAHFSDYSQYIGTCQVTDSSSASRSASRSSYTADTCGSLDASAPKIATLSPEPTVSVGNDQLAGTSEMSPYHRFIARIEAEASKENEPKGWMSRLQKPEDKTRMMEGGFA